MQPDNLIKICPDCSYRNDASHRRCEKCDRNLAGVKSQHAFQTASLPNELPDPVEAQPTAVLDSPLSTRQLLDTTIINDPERLPALPPDTPTLENLSVPPFSKEKFASPEKQKRRKNSAIVILTLIILAVIIVGLFDWLSGRGHITQIPVVPNGLGEFNAQNRELLGVNDGSFAPFLLGPDGQLKQQAVNQFNQGHPDQAIASWQAALNITNATTNTNNDAEAWIYLENQRVLLSSSPYKTLVVGTDLFDSSGAGKSDLQGVYIAQHEFNTANHGFRLRILIANSGTDLKNVSLIARQIVNIAAQDKTVVGVVSWLTSSENFLALPILGAAHIPMISPTASNDKLTGISPYFFHIVPPNNLEGRASALFAEQTLHAYKVIVFFDSREPYSQNLAQDFEKQLRQEKNAVINEEPFTTYNTENIKNLVMKALTTHPDLLYFAAREISDVNNFEDALPTSGPFANTPVLVGDTGYSIHKAAYGRWYFTSFAFPDELNNVLGKNAVEPPFYQEYKDAFNQDGLKPGGYYEYTRPHNEAMLSYDVTSVLTKAIIMAINKQKIATTSDGLKQLTSSLLASTLPDVVWQGVSGLIMFDAGHDPVNKAIVFLAVSAKGIYMKDWLGCFTQTLCRNAS